MEKKGRLPSSSRTMDGQRLFVIACATVIEEMLPLLPSGVGHRVLDFGLHAEPARLRAEIQKAIDESSNLADVLILGYGLCSQGIVGLKAPKSRLVAPRVDDCISIFLGSSTAYREQSRAEPGTYYLTKGWIEAGDSPFGEFDRMVERYGRAKADRMMALMLANYKRLALINTGQYELEQYRDYARGEARRFGLRYEEIQGSNDLVRKMVEGPWNEEFIVVEPGEAIRFDHFFR
jgi:hypothetical protein